jgi:hypothetical protein
MPVDNGFGLVAFMPSGVVIAMAEIAGLENGPVDTSEAFFEVARKLGCGQRGESGSARHRPAPLLLKLSASA